MSQQYLNNLCKNGDLTEIKKLTTSLFPPMYNYGQALIYTCEGGDVDAFKYIMNKFTKGKGTKCNENEAYSRFQMAFNTACFYGHDDIVNLFMSESYTYNGRLPKDNTEGLMNACDGGRSEKVIEILVNSVRNSDNLNKALERACLSKTLNINIIELLIRKVGGGGSKNIIIDPKMLSTLHDVEILNLLINNGVVKIVHILTNPHFTKFIKWFNGEEKVIINSEVKALKVEMSKLVEENSKIVEENNGLKNRIEALMLKDEEMAIEEKEVEEVVEKEVEEEKVVKEVKEDTKEDKPNHKMYYIFMACSTLLVIPHLIHLFY